jgi:hypothetical protein
MTADGMGGGGHDHRPAGSGPVTYTFDLVSVATLRVTTDAGEAAARHAAAALLNISVRAAPGDLEYAGEIPGGTVYDAACISPRGRPYLVEAVDRSGRDVAVSSTELFAEPISGERREELAALLAAYWAAADSPSGDGEHAAASALADAVGTLLEAGPHDGAGPLPQPDTAATMSARGPGGTPGLPAGIPHSRPGRAARRPAPGPGTSRPRSLGR